MPDRRAIVAGLLATAMFPVASQGARLRKAISTIVPFKASPFPYWGKLPDGSAPFLVGAVLSLPAALGLVTIRPSRKG